MGIRKPHPTRTPDSARAYLVHECREGAGEVIHAAEIVAGALRRQASPLDTRERKRALRIAKELRPLVARSSPRATPTIDLLVQQWGAPARRGRPRDIGAKFAQTMLWWAAKYWHRQLTVTELMAAAVAADVEPASDPREKLNIDRLAEEKERLFDTWRRHHTQELPGVLAELADEDRQQREARLAWEARSMAETLADAMTRRPPPWEENPPRFPPGPGRLLRRTG